MKNQFKNSKGNSRQLLLTVGTFCTYGLLVGGLIALNARNPIASEKAMFDTATIDFPASNAGPAEKAASLAYTVFPIQELHRKAKNLPIEVFADPN